MATGFRFTGWDPFIELGRIQEEMNRLFRGLTQAPAQAPPLNVYASPDDVILTAEVPGVSRDDITALQRRFQPGAHGSEEPWT